ASRSGAAWRPGTDGTGPIDAPAGADGITMDGITMDGITMDGSATDGRVTGGSDGSATDGRAIDADGVELEQAPTRIAPASAKLPGKISNLRYMGGFSPLCAYPAL